MTIKEIEERTGMDRANIRFYEKEGLINPTRLDNGYRDYTQKDIDVLLRIKLLRSLHLSVEDIRALQTGEITLENVLGSHLAVLQAEKAAVSAAEDVCRTMQTDRAVNSKVKLTLDHDLTPIVCVGETLWQHEAGITLDLVRAQVKSALYGITAERARKMILAYEPIWAIGTGRTATPDQAQYVCSQMRVVLREMYDARTARAIPILYGGSMNPANAAELIAQPDVDGGLIGGASLDAEKFISIIEAANQ